MILTPDVHAVKQCYVVKAALCTFHPTGKALFWIGDDYIAPQLMVLCTWFRSGWLRQRQMQQGLLVLY